MMGYKETVPVEVEKERDGYIGSLIEPLIGKKTVTKTKKVEHLGLPVSTFNVLLDLLNEHNKEQKKKYKNAGQSNTKTMG